MIKILEEPYPLGLHKRVPPLPPPPLSPFPEHILGSDQISNVPPWITTWGSRGANKETPAPGKRDI